MNQNNMMDLLAELENDDSHFDQEMIDRAEMEFEFEQENGNLLDDAKVEDGFSEDEPELSYEDFLQSKRVIATVSGFEVSLDEIHPKLFGFQRVVTQWGCRKGRCAIFADTGLGKALSSDTNVITPDGYKAIGKIKLDDFVIGSNGKATRVIGIYPQGLREMYLITFSDGTSIKCDGNHLWAVRTKVQKYRQEPYLVKKTSELKDDLISQEGWKWFIPMAEPIEFNHQELPLSPYLLGVLIGDGSISQNMPVISSTDEQILQKVSMLLPDGVTLKKNVGGSCDWRISGGMNGGHHKNPLTKILEYLGLMGKKSESKFIPEVYKYSDLKSRTELLQGLMDTDGYASYDGTISYCTVSKQLAEDFAFLVQSLGGKAPIRTKKTTGQLAYQMSLALPNEINPFSLKRKSDIAKKRTKYFPTRAIVSIEPIGKMNAVCISVDAPDKLYVIEHAIVTHNTFMQVEWSRLVREHTQKPTLIISPLSVARQTVRQSKMIEVDVKYVRNQSEIDPDGINITNYEMLEHFDPDIFGGVALDESSILKSFDGTTRTKLIKMFRSVPYRSCYTATPAPNDYTELGNHAEFLGICTAREMEAMFFIHANKVDEVFAMGKSVRKKQSNDKGQEWRLRHHAKEHFYEWLSSWAMSIRTPSDLGFSDEGYILPKLNIQPHFVDVDYKPVDQLFFTGLKGIGDRSKVRKGTLAERVIVTSHLVNSSKEQFIILCGLNDEADKIHRAIPDSVNVQGSDSPEQKAKAFEDFQDGLYRVLISKPKIAGLGMNFQNAHNMVFLGLNDSWEMYYQCIRRELRFGQEFPVNVYIVISEVEREIYDNVMKKEIQASTMRSELIKHVQLYERAELGMVKTQDKFTYKEDTVETEQFKAMLGDSAIRMKEIQDESVDLSVYSPPFSDLYVYSATEHDLGNSKDWNEFFQHYSFVIKELLRITKQGRLTCVHVSDIPAMASRDGYIGMKDFPGAVIKAYEKEGWIFVGRAIVAKNPQAQAIRTKAKALLFVQLRKDSSHSRPAILDQILLFKKEGENQVPITPVENGEINNETWIDWAGGIWTGIQESDTLQFTTARDKDDEKHIAPLQLGTIERCIKLWSNPGETVFTPFLGIGSEAYTALKYNRKAIGIELKESYFKVAVRNLKDISAQSKSNDLFAWAEQNNK